MNKHINIILVIVITFITIVVLFSFKVDRSITSVNASSFENEYTKHIEKEGGYIFDDYYKVNMSADRK